MEPLLSAEMGQLISRLAAVPRGLALLHQEDPEWVAVQFGVNACVVVQAKGYLDDPEERRWLIEKVRQAHAGEGGLEATPPPEHLPPPLPPSPHDAVELIEAARDHPRGLPFLSEASPEVVAATFRVHPDLVFAARDLLKRDQ